MRTSATVALVTALLFVGAALPLLAQPDLKNTLVGKWEGDIQRANTRESSERTLVIQSVSAEGWKGRWGTPGQGSSQVTGEIDAAAKPPLLKFATKGGAHVVLRLLDEKNLAGTIDFRGTSQGAQDIPVRLKKVE